MAVFLAIVQAAYAAPHDAFLVVPCPSASAVECAALTAHQPLRQGVFTGVGGQSGRSALFRRASRRVSPSHLCLRCIVSSPIHDSFVVILYQVHRKLTSVADRLAADAVAPEGLLQKHIAAIFLTGENAAHRRDRPFFAAGDVQNPIRFQSILNHSETRSCKEFTVNPLDNFSLLRNDFGLIVFSALVSEQLFVLNRSFTLVHRLPHSPADIRADALTFRLREGSHHRDQKLAVGFQRIDVLLLENHRYAVFFQDSDVVQTVNRVPCEA